ncbi:hypothetical protein PYW07_002406 [Mythimna separata]|uniref:FP protein C-terminal domain-containing protein n=1 Tax=Mythimna separata TaxID=271217 RepID=A0AAD8DU43_MYTSE|nr:hypothetical protein PYW07_002406 [Mythimna separata]
MDTSTCTEAALDSTSSATDFATELRLFKEELRSEFRLMHREFLQLRTEMAQLKDSLKASDQRVDTLEARVGSLEQRLEQKVLPDRGLLENTIDELRYQLNARDQELLLNDVEVSGVPESKEESALHLVKVLGTKLGVTIDEKDVAGTQRGWKYVWTKDGRIFARKEDGRKAEIIRCEDDIGRIFC